MDQPTEVGITITPVPAKRLLIVEDDSTVATYYAAVLRSHFDIEIATTFADGFERVRRKPCLDAMILDLTLPNGRGLSLVRRFQDATPDIPMIVITGEDFTADQVLNAGAQEFLKKPYTSPLVLINTVFDAIARHRVRKDFTPLEEVLQEFKEIRAASKANIDSVCNNVIRKVS